jgi:hypothetical protein
MPAEMIAASAMNCRGRMAVQVTSLVSLGTSPVTACHLSVQARVSRHPTTTCEPVELSLRCLTNTGHVDAQQVECGGILQSGQQGHTHRVGGGIKGLELHIQGGKPELWVCGDTQCKAGCRLHTMSSNAIDSV